MSIFSVHLHTCTPVHIDVFRACVYFTSSTWARTRTAEPFGSQSPVPEPAACYACRARQRQPENLNCAQRQAEGERCVTMAASSKLQSQASPCASHTPGRSHARPPRQDRENVGRCCKVVSLGTHELEQRQAWRSPGGSQAALRLTSSPHFFRSACRVTGHKGHTRTSQVDLRTQGHVTVTPPSTATLQQHTTDLHEHHQPLAPPQPSRCNLVSAKCELAPADKARTPQFRTIPAVYSAGHITVAITRSDAARVRL